MKCAICKNGYTNIGHSTIAFDNDSSVIVFQKVPTEICDNCGEEYVTSKINSALVNLSIKEFSKGISFELLNYSSIMNPKKFMEA